MIELHTHVEESPRDLQTKLMCATMLLECSGGLTFCWDKHEIGGWIIHARYRMDPPVIATVGDPLVIG